MPRETLNGTYLIISTVALLALVLFVAEAWRNPTAGAYWHVAALVGSIIVAAGWIVTSENTVRNNARQHTIAVLLKHDGEESKTRWKIINDALPGSATLGIDCMLIETKKPWGELYDAVDTELNLYEFVAVGVIKEVFDEPIMRNSYRKDFLDVFHMAEPYIADVTSKDNEGDVWNNYSALCAKWGPSLTNKYVQNQEKAAIFFLGFAFFMAILLPFWRWSK